MLSALVLSNSSSKLTGMAQTRSAPAPAAREWALWRQDDNGNRFEMQRSCSRAKLEELEAMYERRGHKQLY